MAFDRKVLYALHRSFKDGADIFETFDYRYTYIEEALARQGGGFAVSDIEFTMGVGDGDLKRGAYLIFTVLFDSGENVWSRETGERLYGLIAGAIGNSLKCDNYLINDRYPIIELHFIL